MRGSDAEGATLRYLLDGLRGRHRPVGSRASIVRYY
jgi:hypothetical protein